jgi:hypothetical protein
MEHPVQECMKGVPPTPARFMTSQWKKPLIFTNQGLSGLVAWGGIEKPVLGQRSCALRVVTKFSGYGTGYGREKATDVGRGSVSKSHVCRHIAVGFSVELLVRHHVGGQVDQDGTVRLSRNISSAGLRPSSPSPTPQIHTFATLVKGR